MIEYNLESVTASLSTSPVAVVSTNISNRSLLFIKGSIIGYDDRFDNHSAFDYSFVANRISGSTTLTSTVLVNELSVCASISSDSTNIVYTLHGLTSLNINWIISSSSSIVVS